MITAIVLYDLPSHIDRTACRAHFEGIAPGFLQVPGLVRKQFICDAEGHQAGGSYLWESRSAAEAFYSGTWLDGIITRYGAPPRITYFDTFAIADVPQGTVWKGNVEREKAAPATRHPAAVHDE